jgi:glycosyltransferase involved in cell wall biosynthesis
LVEPKDPSSLARVMIRVLKNPAERLRVSQNALSTVGRFSITKIVLQYQDLYREITAGKM